MLDATNAMLLTAPNPARPMHTELLKQCLQIARRSKHDEPCSYLKIAKSHLNTFNTASFHSKGCLDSKTTYSFNTMLDPECSK